MESTLPWSWWCPESAYHGFGGGAWMKRQAPPMGDSQRLGSSSIVCIVEMTWKSSEKLHNLCRHSFIPWMAMLKLFCKYGSCQICWSELRGVGGGKEKMFWTGRLFIGKLLIFNNSLWAAVVLLKCTGAVPCEWSLKCR